MRGIHGLEERLSIAKEYLTEYTPTSTVDTATSTRANQDGLNVVASTKDGNHGICRESWYNRSDSRGRISVNHKRVIV